MVPSGQGCLTGTGLLKRKARRGPCATSLSSATKPTCRGWTVTCSMWAPLAWASIRMYPITSPAGSAATHAVPAATYALSCSTVGGGSSATASMPSAGKVPLRLSQSPGCALGLLSLPVELPVQYLPPCPGVHRHAGWLIPLSVGRQVMVGWMTRPNTWTIGRRGTPGGGGEAPAGLPGEGARRTCLPTFLDVMLSALMCARGSALPGRGGAVEW